MIRIKAVDAQNLFDVCKLTTNHNDIGTTMEEYLCCNAISIAEANYHLELHPNAIYNNNVLIGCGAKILGPFKVGDGARIAANSVVLSEVPEQATAVGIPAQIVRIAGKATHFADDVDQTSVENPTLERINALSERLDFIERLLDEQYRRGDFPKPTSK